MNEKTRTDNRHGQRDQTPSQYSTAATWAALAAVLSVPVFMIFAMGVLLWV